MNKIAEPPQHHSLSDWDNRRNYGRLTVDQFVSPPKSIERIGPASCIVWCRFPGTINLPQGQLVSYLRLRDNQWIRMCFRIQSPVGSEEYNTGYTVRLWEGQPATLHRMIAGSEVHLGHFTFTAPKDTWFRARITWWITMGEGGIPILAVHLQVEEGGIWVDYGTLEDEDNMWADSELNRVGLWINGTLCYADDTEIWGPC